MFMDLNTLLQIEIKVADKQQRLEKRRTHKVQYFVLQQAIDVQFIRHALQISRLR